MQGTAWKPILTRRQALCLTGAAALTTLGGLPLANAKAPMLRQPKWDFYRFKLGAFEVTIIRDGATTPAGPYPAFGADQFEEDVHELLIFGNPKMGNPANAVQPAHRH